MWGVGLDAVAFLEFFSNRTRTYWKNTKMFMVVTRNVFYAVGTKKVLGSCERIRINFTDTVEMTIEASKVLATFGCLVESLIAYRKHH